MLDDGEGEVIRWFASTITVKASGPAFDIAMTTEVAGSEPPLHVHEETDEAVFVVDGSLTVYAGGEVFAATAGSFALVPRGVPHTYVVDSGTACLVVVFAPSGALGMYSDAERVFGERGMPARPRDGDIARVAPALEANDVMVLAPHARARGLEAPSE